ncbi:hypothetical protein ACQ4PT_045636 [Festuca glaucescens]
MASRNTSAQQHGGDRLSDLKDELLGTILAFLPIKDAARAAVLARRYRHAFAGVNTISFVEQRAHYGVTRNDYTYCLEAVEQRSKNGEFIDGVNAALICRRRCAGDINAAPRAFRVQFGCFDEWDEPMVSQWLSFLLKRSAGQELHLDLRLQLTIMGEHNFDGQEWGYRGAGSADGECLAHSRYEADRYTLPARLFSCIALRTLCLGGCDLDPPDRIRLPFLETLLLSSIPCSDNIQRLISSCPRLVDLTLERCGYTPISYGPSASSHVDRSYTITVVDKRLHRLALRCCHNLVRASVDATELRAFEYRGAVPAESFLTLHGAHNISSCTIDLCGKMVYDRELPRFAKFLELFAGTKHLHLKSTHLGADIESDRAITTGLPCFPALTRLQLTGYLHTGSIEALARILRQAPSVQILSLFMKQRSRETFHNVREQWRELGDDELDVSMIPCLRNRLREINLVHYQGFEAQRYAARLLLRNAIVLERMCVALPRGTLELQMKLKDEIQGWVVNTGSTETIFF